MKIKFTIFFIVIIASCSATFMSAQCVDDANIYAFNFDDKTYEIVRENRTWLQAASCAVERGGYLAEVNSEIEQDILFATARFSASIIQSNTTAFECDPCSFVWLGGNDILEEGNWIWDGDNDTTGIQFWMGDVNGSPVGGVYTNWGTEPDNFNDQDAAALGLIHWLLGDAGQWADLAVSNELYYIIEYDMILGTDDAKPEIAISIYPNPVQDDLSLDHNNQYLIKSIDISSLTGQKVKTIKNPNRSFLKTIDISDLKTGIYFLNIHFENGNVVVRNFVKL